MMKVNIFYKCPADYSREEMIFFLMTHTRLEITKKHPYTTYANRLSDGFWKNKTKMRQILKTPGFRERAQEEIMRFAAAHGYDWQADFAKGGEYLILLMGGIEKLANGRMAVYCNALTPIDQDAYFAAWSDEDLRRRVALIADFDFLCDTLLSLVEKLAEEYESAESDGLTEITRPTERLVTNLVLIPRKAPKSYCGDAYAREAAGFRLPEINHN